MDPDAEQWAVALLKGQMSSPLRCGKDLSNTGTCIIFRPCFHLLDELAKNQPQSRSAWNHITNFF